MMVMVRRGRAAEAPVQASIGADTVARLRIGALGIGALGIVRVRAGMGMASAR